MAGTSHEAGNARERADEPRVNSSAGSEPRRTARWPHSRSVRGRFRGGGVAAKPEARPDLEPQRGARPTQGHGDVLGGLLHLGPPAVVGVADEQQDLAPEQHEGRVCGGHGAHARVQALQAVETAVGAVSGEESRGGRCDSPEHS